MSTFKTPLRQKRFELHSAIRSQQLETMRKQVRQQLLKTEKKKQQSGCYSRILMRLDLDCCDVGARQELERMFFEDGFVFDEERVGELLPVLRELWGRVLKDQGKQLTEQDMKSENGENTSERKQYQKQHNNQEKDNNKTSPYTATTPATNPHPQPNSPLHSLLKLISLLAYNTKTYPQYGTFDNPQIITFIFQLTTFSPDNKLKSTCYKLLVLLLRNPKNKPLLLQLGILKIMTEIVGLVEYSETVLSVVFRFQFNGGFQFKEEYVRQVGKVLENVEGVFVAGGSLGKMGKFVGGMVNRLEMSRKKLGVELAVVVLGKLSKIKEVLKGMEDGSRKTTINNLDRWEVYGRCLEKVVSALGWVDRYDEGNEAQNKVKQMIIELFQPLWKMYYDNATQQQPKLPNMQTIQSHLQMQHPHNHPQPTCSSLSDLSPSFYQSFYPVLCYVITRFSTSPDISQIKQRFLQLYWSFFTNNFTKLTFNRQLLLMFLQHQGMVSLHQLSQLLQVYKLYQDDLQLRTQCLKILNRVRRLYHTSSPGTVQQYYYEFKAVTYLDEHTQFLLNTRPVPTDLEYYRFCQQLAVKNLEDKQHDDYEEYKQQQQDTQIKEELSKSIRRQKNHLKSMMETSGEEDGQGQ